MKVVGLTGGIGSGKTTVAKMFHALGVPVYIADLEAKNLMENNVIVKAAIIEKFGPQAYINGRPDRKYLANEVFQDQKKLEVLNSIIHPAVAKDFERWRSSQNSVYVIYEAAILFEKGGNLKCDYTILVTAPKDIRIERVKQRDGVTVAEVEARISFQWSDERKRKLADFIIENIKLEDVKLEVASIHNTILKS